MVLQQLSRFCGAADAHPAFSEAQIQYLIDPSAFLQQGILSHHADVRRAVFHIGGNVRALGQEKTQLLLLIHENQFPGAFILHFLTGQADAFQKGKGFVRKPSLGEGKGQISLLFHFYLVFRRRQAPSLFRRYCLCAAFRIQVQDLSLLVRRR